MWRTTVSRALLTCGTKSNEMLRGTHYEIVIPLLRSWLQANPTPLPDQYPTPMSDKICLACQALHLYVQASKHPRHARLHKI